MFIRLGLFIATLVAFTGGSAFGDKVTAMSADASVAKSERQAVLNFGRLWIQDERVSLPVEYCPHEKECRAAGVWTVSLSEGWVQKHMSRNVPVLVTPRYDQIKVEGNAVTLVTPSAEVVVDGYTVQGPEPYVIPTYGKFKDRFLKSLDVLAPTIQAAQGAFNQVRAENLSDKEEGTFMAQQAKSAGIPLSVYEKLSTSTFAFGVWMPKLRGSISVKQTKTTDIRTGKTKTSYDTSLTAPLLPKLVVAQFDGQKFRIEKEVALGGSAMGLLSTLMASGAGVETKYQPMESHAQMIFEEVFHTSLRDAFVQIANKLKTDPRFSLSAPITVNEKREPVIELGVKEGLRVGHPFQAARMIDGEMKKQGLFRVYDAANNCKKPASSVLENRGGSFEEYDLAVEEPYGGFALGVRPVGGAMVGYTNEGETDDELRTSAGLDFDLQGDLGYLLNISALADWYMHLRVGSLLPMGDWADMSDLFVIPTFDLGFEKRLYFGGTYLGIEADLSSQTWYNTFTDATSYGGDVEFLQAFVGGGATLALGQTFSSSFNMSLGLSAKYFTLATQSVTVDGSTFESDTTPSASYLYVGATLSFEFGSEGAGPYALAYGASRGCKKK